VNKSLGLLEVKGLAAGFSALDTMLKTAEVKYVNDQKKLGAGLVTVIVEGNISAVKAAVDAGYQTAAKIVGQNNVLTATTIPRPHPLILDLIKIKKQKLSIKQTANQEDIKGCAVGLVEIYGYAAALIGTDAALKTANVRLLGLDKTKGKPDTPGLIMFLKLVGQVGDVEMALDATLEAIKPLTGSTSSSIIARPDDKLSSLIKAGI